MQTIVKKTALACIIVLTVFYLTNIILTLTSEYLVKPVERRTGEIQQLLPQIYDKDGILLAWNEVEYDVFYDNSVFNTNEVIYEDLNKFLQVFPSFLDNKEDFELKIRYKDDKLRYNDILLMRNVSRDFYDKFIEYKQSSSQIGFYIKARNIRKYDPDLQYLPVGEFDYQTLLSSGYHSYLATLLEINNINGIDLSISARVSTELQNILNSTVLNLGGTGGAISVIDIQDGSILSMVSSPMSSMKILQDRESYVKAIGDKSFPLLNRNYQLAYPNGSTMKIITGLTALDTGRLIPSDILYSDGVLDLPGNIKFKEFTGLPYGNLDIYAAIRKSSNIFFCKLFRDKGVTIDELNKYQSMLGLGSKVILDITGESAGNIPSPVYKSSLSDEPWFLGDSCNAAIGQGYTLVTPIQLTNVVATFAREGKYVDPHLTKAIKYNNLENLVSFSSIVPTKKLDIDEKNIDIITTGMHNLASNVGLENWAIKTGTAEVPNDKRPHAWITGFFPFDHPRYAVTIFIENGENSYLLYPILKQIESVLIKYNE